MKKTTFFSLSLVLVIWCLPNQQLAATSFTVQMTGTLRFSPSSLSIGPGDTVIWTNVSTFAHTSTSGTPPGGDGLWDSSIVNGGSAFTFTFTNLAPKTYPYFCSFHASFGMTGTLTVTNSVSAPSLSDPMFRDGKFQFTVLGQTGSTYITESSQNLSQWSSISTNVATSNVFNVIDNAATNRMGFYRIRQGP